MITSALLGIGLAMDAFSVSLANALAEKGMNKVRMTFMAGTYGLFQFIMPMTGWLFVHIAVTKLELLERFLPWIALILLCTIGIRTIAGAHIRSDEVSGSAKIGAGILLMQGVATSIDALSVGFTTASYGASEAALSSAVIGIVTFIICFAGLLIGRKAGDFMSRGASVLGGCILIAVGIRIFLG